MRYYVTLPSQQELPVDISQKPNGSAAIKVEGRPVLVDAVETDGALSVRIGDRVVDLWLDGTPPDVRFVASGLRLTARVESEQARSVRASHRLATSHSEVSTPMPGRVVKLLVSEGDRVQAGAPVVVVEAMKMENELCAERAGTVVEICATAGQQVDGGVPLVKLA